MTHRVAWKHERGAQKIGGVAEKHTGVTEKRIWVCVCEDNQRGGLKTHIFQSGTHGAGQTLHPTAIIIRCLTVLKRTTTKIRSKDDKIIKESNKLLEFFLVFTESRRCLYPLTKIARC